MKIVTNISVLMLGVLMWTGTAQALERVYGFCAQGSVTLTVAGFGPITQPVLGLTPGCKVQALQTGTSTPASLFSNNLFPPTALSNPFTADASTAYFFFYVANGRYDINILDPTGSTILFTFGDVEVYDSAVLTTSGASVTCAPTVSLNAAQASIFSMTLNCNVTSMTVTGQSLYQIVQFQFCQNSSGSWTVAWPSTFPNPPTINAGPGTCTNAQFWWDGVQWNQQQQNQAQVILVDELPGADLGAKLNACDAALPEQGGVCDARGLTGAWNLSTAANFTEPVTLIFNPGLTVTQSAAVSFTGESVGTPLSGVTVEAHGAHFVLTANATFTQPKNLGTDGTSGNLMWQLTNVNNASIDGLVLDGNRANQSVTSVCWNGLGLYGVNDVHVDANSIFQNIQRHAIFVTSNTLTSPTSGPSNQVWVQNDQFINDGNPTTTSSCIIDSGGVAIQNGVNNTAIVPAGYWIKNNYFTGVFNQLDVTPQGSAMKDIWFEDNQILAPTGSGSSFAQLLVEGPVCQPSGPCLPTASIGHHGVHINGNSIDGSAMRNIWFAQGNQLEAAHNTITASSDTGIAVDSQKGGLSNVTVGPANNISGTGGDAIFESQHTNAIDSVLIFGNPSSGYGTGVFVQQDTAAGNTHLQVWGNNGSGDTASVSFPSSFPGGMSTQFLCDSSAAIWTCTNGGMTSSILPLGNVGTTGLGLNITSNTTFKMTLTSNSGLGAVTNPPAGTHVTFEIVDPSAGYSFTWTTASCGGGCAFKGGMSMTPSKTNIQTFLFDGITYQAEGPGSSN